ncbi:MAG TPA: SLC13 family permease [Methylomirabilota bacterium]|nr:SLC13 family permease [Methylomirabilota bacterium]
MAAVVAGADAGDTVLSRTAAALARPGAARGPALALSLALLLAALFLPPLAEGLPVAGQRALVVTLISIVLWTTEALEPGVTALLGVALLALTGSGMRGALQGFASPVPYFLVGVLTMGVAVVRSGLAERLARAILERARGRSLAVYLQLVLAFPALTFVLPSATTRSGILIHIYDEVFTLAAVPRGAEVAKAVMLALASINRLASTALLTGGITPVMSAAIIAANVDGRPISWTGWFLLMGVPYYTILLLGGVLTWALYRRGFARDLPATAPVARRPLGGAEWRTVAILLGASALWLTDAWHHLDPALPALLAFAALLAPGVGPLRWGDLERGVGWANFFVIAASISLAQALSTSGAAAWLGRRLVGSLPALGASAPGTIVLLMLGATALRAIVPNISGFLALALPIAMSVGRETGLSPVVCALAVMITGDAVIYYPAQSASALVIYERGHVSAGEMLRFGLWMTLVGWIAVLAVALPWWSLVGLPLRP